MNLTSAKKIKIDGKTVKSIYKGHELIYGEDNRTPVEINLTSVEFFGRRAIDHVIIYVEGRITPSIPNVEINIAGNESVLTDEHGQFTLIVPLRWEYTEGDYWCGETTFTAVGLNSGLYTGTALYKIGLLHGVGDSIYEKLN